MSENNSNSSGWLTAGSLIAMAVGAIGAGFALYQANQLSQEQENTHQQRRQYEAELAKKQSELNAKEKEAQGLRKIGEDRRLRSLLVIYALLEGKQIPKEWLGLLLQETNEVIEERRARLRLQPRDTQERNVIESLEACMADVRGGRRITWPGRDMDLQDLPPALAAATTEAEAVPAQREQMELDDYFAGLLVRRYE